LRQLKIVKPTRQPGEKTNELEKTKLPLHVVWMSFAITIRLKEKTFITNIL
jgi:hypothetical protein